MIKTILITGVNGFVGKNLLANLNNVDNVEILKYGTENTFDQLEEFALKADFIFHLAGVNRPQEVNEFAIGNKELTEKLIHILSGNGKSTSILMPSSIQASLDNPYGISKKGAEDAVFKYGKEKKAAVYIYRLPNLFGKWCKPNYNSAVATFCHNIARDLEIQVNDPNTELTLCYIDDVLAEFLRVLEGKGTKEGAFYRVPETHKIKLGELTDKLYSFRENRETLVMPSLESEFDKNLYGTYLSYLEEDNFSYKLKKNVDNRGWLAEFIKSESMVQIFISKTKPGITRGNHWHHTKVEKFLVIHGNAVIKFRKIDTDEVLEYVVNEESLEVVDIPVGYTHSITNIGKDELITLFWASEMLNPDKKDTYYVEV